MLLIAYIDESAKKNMLSLGIYISRGFDKLLRDYIINLYDSKWREYGVGRYCGEAKFNRFVMGLRKKHIKLSNVGFIQMLRCVANFMGELGYIIGVVVADTKITSTLMWDLHRFLTRLRIPRPTIEKYLLIHTALKCRKINKIILDTGFQISIPAVRRILKALKINIAIQTASSIQNPGLEIADFIAGISPLIETYNINTYRFMNCNIHRM